MFDSKLRHAPYGFVNISAADLVMNSVVTRRLTRIVNVPRKHCPEQGKRKKNEPTLITSIVRLVACDFGRWKFDNHAVQQQ